MSDLSIIAHDYALNAEFAGRFNAAVLRLKRLYLLGRKRNEPDPKIEESRIELRELLTSLIDALSDSRKEWSAEQAKVPVDVVERLRDRVRSELPEAITELQNTAKELGD